MVSNHAMSLGNVELKVLRMEGDDLGGPRDMFRIVAGVDEGESLESLISIAKRRDLLWQLKSTKPFIDIDEVASFSTHSHSSKLFFKCFRNNEEFGVVYLPLEYFPQNQNVEKWYSLHPPKGSYSDKSIQAQVLLNIKYGINVNSTSTSTVSFKFSEVVERQGVRIYPSSQPEVVDQFHLKIIHSVIVLSGVERDSGVSSEISLDVTSSEASVAGEISRFCFPLGLEKRKEMQNSISFDFVLKDGEKFLYGTCLSHWIGDNTGYLPQCICIISFVNEFDSIRKLLKQMKSSFFSNQSIHLSQVEQFAKKLCESKFKSQQSFQTTIFPSLDADQELSISRSVYLYSLPSLGYSISSIFQLFSESLIIDTAICALTERNVIVHSSQLSLLCKYCQTITTLCYPFVYPYSFMYIPLLPDSLSDYVYAPVPFFIGMHSDTFDQIHVPHDTITIDLDAGLISSVIPPVSIPQLIKQELCERLRTIRMPYFKELDQVNSTPAKAENDNLLYQFEFLKLWSRLLNDYRSYLMFANDSHVIFIGEEFLKNNFNTRSFLSKFIRTQTFRQFIESHALCSSPLHDLIFFHETSPKDLQPLPQKHRYRGRFLSPSLATKHGLELMKQSSETSFNGTFLWKLAIRIATSQPVDSASVISFGELFVFSHWRTCFVEALESCTQHCVKISIATENWEHLIFWSKLVLLYCFDDSSFHCAKRLLDLSTRFWNDVRLLECIKSAKIFKHQQFWVHSLHYDLYQTKRMEDEEMKHNEWTQLDEDDAYHVISSTICTLREISIEKAKAHEILTVLCLSENLPLKLTKNLEELFEMVFESKLSTGFQAL